jgi:hypothetical protein
MSDFTGAVSVALPSARPAHASRTRERYLRDADMDAAWAAGTSPQMVKRERLGQATRAWNQAARVAERSFQTLDAELAGAGICLSASASRLTDTSAATTTRCEYHQASVEQQPPLGRAELAELAHGPHV